jgi:murein DD-endopeptidase MepM/ murein hydrolase activator NlpD
LNATDSAREHRPRRLSLLIGIAVATATIGAGGAWAQTPDPATDPAEPIEGLTDTAPDDAATDDGAAAADPADTATTEPAPAEEQGGGQKAQRGAGRLTLTREEASPNKVFWDGSRKAKFEYKFSGGQAVELVIEVVKSKSGADQMVRRYRVEQRDGGKMYELTWDGRRANDDLVKKGTFYFRVSEAGGRRLKRTGADGNRQFRMFPAIFPVDGSHQYWDGFGAGRNHAGQDVGANCGTPLRAAEPGTVTTKAYNGGGYGYYVVIAVRGSNRSELYGHMRDKATVRQGEHVGTGERIGKVGDTGNASGCHLHFEYRPNDVPSAHVTDKLKAWDKYS